MRRVLLVALFLAGVALAWLFLREGVGPEGDALTRGRESGATTPLLTAPDQEDTPESRLVGAPGASETEDGAGDGMGRAAIRGVVLDPEGEARHSSIVELCRWVPRTTSDGRDVLVQMQVGTRRTGGDGRFAFEDLEPGGYWASGLAPPGLLAGRVDLELKGEDVDVTLAYRRAVFARILVQTDAGEPIEGAFVTVYDGESHFKSGVTDPAGTVPVYGMDPRREYRLRVKAPRERHMVLFDAEQTNWEPGDDRIVLERAHVLSGRVVDDEGCPVARAVVAHHLEDDPQDWALYYARVDGTFLIGRLAAGPVTLSAGPPGISIPRDGASVTVEAGRQDVVLTVSRGANLNVEITNWLGEWDVAVDLGSIVLTPEGGGDARSARIRKDVTAEIEGLEEGVSYVLWGEFRVLPEHYLYRTGVRASEEPLEVRVEKGGVIKGRVIAPDGIRPISASLSGPGVQKQAALDATDGTFRILGVPPGTWTVTAIGAKSVYFDPKTDTWWATCTASAGEEVELTLERYEPENR